jgi:hypothetical protein
VFWEDAARLANALGPAARRDLLRVLTSPSEVRADVIRQLHERPDGQEMADLLIFLEEWEWASPGHDRGTVPRVGRDLVPTGACDTGWQVPHYAQESVG